MQIKTDKDAPLIDVLSVLSPNSSKTTLRSWVKDGRVKVDGSLVKRGNEKILQGQTVIVGPKEQFVDKGGIKIVYEDSHFVAIEKPTGMLSVSTAFEKEDTAHAILKAKYYPRRVYVVHRLDQDTSGVMLFALSEECFSRLKVLFEKHDIERSYCAIVEGKMKQTSGTWKSFLYEDAQYMVHSSDDPTKGQEAITHFKIKNSTTRHTRLELKLETGKKNQIRVHCQQQGFPVVGDKKYGAQTDPFHRLCLHAQFLAFDHPMTGKQMVFSSPVPPIFDRLVSSKS